MKLLNVTLTTISYILEFIFAFFTIINHMYPYHNKIRQRIYNNELIRYEYVNRYKSITPCLLLYFSTEPRIRPVREHRFDEYEAIFNKLFST